MSKLVLASETLVSHSCLNFDIPFVKCLSTHLAKPYSCQNRFPIGLKDEQPPNDPAFIRQRVVLAALPGFQLLGLAHLLHYGAELAAYSGNSTGLKCRGFAVEGARSRTLRHRNSLEAVSTSG